MGGLDAGCEDTGDTCEQIRAIVRLLAGLQRALDLDPARVAARDVMRQFITGRFGDPGISGR